MSVNYSRYFLVPGVFERDNELFFDHDFEFSDDPRERTIQYKACGIQNSTVYQIITFLYKEITIHMVNHWIWDFGTVWSFRSTSETRDRAKWFMESKKRTFGSMTAKDGFKPDAESIGCINMPLLNIRHRFNKKNPLTKVEKQLVHEIRSYNDPAKLGGNKGFFSDLLSGR